MGKRKDKRRPPVPTERDERAREREKEPAAAGDANAPDGISGDWS